MVIIDSTTEPKPILPISSPSIEARQQHSLVERQQLSAKLVVKHDHLALVIVAARHRQQHLREAPLALEPRARHDKHRSPTADHGCCDVHVE